MTLTFKHTNLFARRVLFFILFLVGIIFVGLRDPYTVGRDSENYFLFFYSILDTDIFLTNFEIGYSLFNQVIAKLFGNDYAYPLFLATGVISVGGVLIFLNKYSQSLFLSCLLFFLLRFFDWHFSMMRQVIAISFILLSFKYIIENKIFYYILLVVCAAFFHRSALIFVPFYFLINIVRPPKLSPKIVILLNMTVLLLLKPIEYLIYTICNYIPQLNDYMYYLSNETFQSGIGTIIIFILFFALFVIILINNDDYCNKLSSDADRRINYIFSYSSLTGIIILAISIRVAQFERLALYFLTPICVMAINILLTQKKWKTLLAIIIILFASYVVIHYFKDGWVNIYPYDFFEAS